MMFERHLAGWQQLGRQRLHGQMDEQMTD